MHYCSKLSRTDKIIEFLELKLFEDSHFIDDLAKKIDKLKFPPTKYTKETKKLNMFRFYMQKKLKQISITIKSRLLNLSITYYFISDIIKDYWKDIV